MMNVKLEITAVRKFAEIFLEHMSACAEMDMSCRMMATLVQVRLYPSPSYVCIIYTTIDINECELGYCNHFCNNTEGSFICSCQDGYALDVDNRTCIGEFNAFILEFVHIITLYRY